MQSAVVDGGLVEALGVAGLGISELRQCKGARRVMRG